MRILLISDVHANINALESVIKDAGRVDSIWCAGDYVDYGTDPHEVIEWFRGHSDIVHCVTGNHDKHLIQAYDDHEADMYRGTIQYKWVHDNCDRVTPEDVDWLRGLPEHLTLDGGDGCTYLMQHQYEYGNMAYNMPECEEKFEEFFAQYAQNPSKGNAHREIFGHTHRSCVHILSGSGSGKPGAMWLNPGSVSYRRPDDNDKNAHYMILEGGSVEFHACPYDRSRSFARAMEYVKSGTMLKTDLQDAMFFFGNAKTTRDELPREEE